MARRRWRCGGSWLTTRASEGAQARRRGHPRASLEEALKPPSICGIDFERLDAALEELAAFAPDKARIVELRYFAGLSIQETADLLEVAPATVKRHWTFARAWLTGRSPHERGTAACRSSRAKTRRARGHLRRRCPCDAPARAAVLAARCGGRPRPARRGRGAAGVARSARRLPARTRSRRVRGAPTTTTPAPRPIACASGRPRPISPRRAIGQGGMGNVYLAERAEASSSTRRDQGHRTRRCAAATRPAASAPSGRSSRRSSTRNIVTLLDGGVTPAAQAYLVMEYVDGRADHRRTADAAAFARDASPLVRQVCGAVQYAHQHGIVHRDLKPGNILVTPTACRRCSTSASPSCSSARIGARRGDTTGARPAADAELREPRAAARAAGHDGDRRLRARRADLRAGRRARGRTTHPARRSTRCSRSCSRRSRRSPSASDRTTPDATPIRGRD